MKKIITLVFLVVTLSVKSQQSDILYIPDQNSLVVSYNYRQVGLYFGGFYTTTLPQPYIYTTPYSIMNRIGLSYVSKNNTFSIMGGAFLEHYVVNVEMSPDVWIKVYPIRLITKNPRTLDFSLGLNYSKGFRYGVGLSIPF
jgi:hypothetical protein